MIVLLNERFEVAEMIGISFLVVALDNGRIVSVCCDEAVVSVAEKDMAAVVGILQHAFAETEKGVLKSEVVGKRGEDV